MRKASFVIAIVSVFTALAIMVWATFFDVTENLPRLPAMQTTGVGITLALFLYVASLLRRAPRPWPLVALHAGILLVFAGYQADQYFGERGTVYVLEGSGTQGYVDEGNRDRPLPFELRLLKFNLSTYEGTAKPDDFASRIAGRLPGGETFEGTVSVNRPLHTPHGELYQKSCGIEVQDDSVLMLSVVDRGIGAEYPLHINDTVTLPSGRRLTVTNFSPAFAKKDGKFYTTTQDFMVNPAYLTVLDDDDGQRAAWVEAAHPENSPFADLTLTFGDFTKVQYSVLEFVHSPCRGLIYLGFALTILGYAVPFLVRKHHGCA